MIHRSRLALLHLIVVLVICSLAAMPSRADNNCGGGGKPRPDEGGIGGTGARPGGPEEDDSGIGGTGAQPDGPDEDDSGLGGTGISGDTGIIGTITGFASICVGKVEIHYDAGTTVQVDGQPASADHLAVGQVVEVLASGTGSEVRAQTISIHHIVAGPVTRIDPAGNEFDVIGQTVQLPPREESDDAAQKHGVAPAGYQLGAVVQISGFRRADGVIVASLVTSSEGDSARLAGPVARVEPGMLAVGATQVRVASDTQVSVGDEIRISGRWEGNQLVDTSIEPIPRVPFEGRVARVDIEGYATPETAGRVKVGPFVFEVPPSASGETKPQRDALVRVRGVVQDRRAVVERIRVMREPPERPEPRSEGAPGHGTGLERTGQDGVAPGGRPAQDHQDSMPPRARNGSSFGAPDRLNRPEGPAGAQKPERPETMQQPERPGTMQKPERPDTMQKPERPESMQKPERPETMQRPQRPESMQKPERPAYVERPPRPDRPDFRKPQ